MARSASLPFPTLGHRLATSIRALREAGRLRIETARLDALPRERLEDMGIAPHPEGNLRHSGQAGRLPQTQLW